jgi:phage tail-like protein
MADIEDPLIGFKYSLKIGSQVAGYFTEVGGLNIEYEPVELKIVNEKGVPIILQQPGRVKYTDITLKRGITSSMDIWNWRKLIEDGKITDARTAGTITMHKEDGTPVTQWHFENGWPSKVTGPQVKADSNEYGVEELTIVHERLYRAAV